MAVRKILGATASTLIKLIGKEYLVVLVVGAMVSIPLSYVWIRQWLEAFAYRADISPSSYVLMLIVVCGLLFTAIGLQVIRSASMNPADTLRDE